MDGDYSFDPRWTMPAWTQKVHDTAWRKEWDERIARKVEGIMVADAELKPEDHTNPSHYREHPSGVECITVTEHMTFNVGNAIKYLWRADLKHESPISDLEKAAWYINREIERRRSMA